MRGVAMRRSCAMLVSGVLGLAWMAGHVHAQVTEAAAAPSLTELQGHAAQPAGVAPKAGLPFELDVPPTAQMVAALAQVNAQRAAGATCGDRGSFPPAPPVRWSAQLTTAAELHAKDIANRRELSHTGGDGSSVGERVKRTGYDWQNLGENASRGYADMAAAVVGWIKSPGHCANLMGAKFREIGLAESFAQGDSFGWYRVMVLAVSFTQDDTRDDMAIAALAAVGAQRTDVRVALDYVNLARSMITHCQGRKLPPLAPLTWEPRLAQAAQGRARNPENYSGPFNVSEEIERLGLPWRAVTAPMGLSREGPVPLLQTWLRDDCSKMLNPEYSRIGFAGSPSGNAGEMRWVMILLGLKP